MNRLVLISAVVVGCGCFPMISSAAIVSTSSLTVYGANTSATQQIVDFDSTASGTSLNALSGITFTETNGDVLMISDAGGDALANGPTFGINSVSNFVNRENPIGVIPPTVTFDETSEVVFDFDQAQNSVGLFVYFDRFNPINAGTIALSTTGGLATVSVGTALEQEDLPVNDTAYFLGLYDDGGNNSISQVRLTTQLGSGTMRYVFDHVMLGQVSAVPEPSAFILLTLIGGIMAVRRRRV
ncbi:PEP-CTERM sorting domain-containing protein [Stieleria varia]|uniref:PEP-CTERM protein-sorting domain-containing protein n=1 Tax=Stieleria varia TaxID=2528005 RepID=A0A5C6AGB4_9BACT|nr:PEP-CTERM sorting domain-containing protein [Stieleria varia]TWT98446.1 hypothetical protein Pla52n_49600 [Stieleria varia]